MDPAALKSLNHANDGHCMTNQYPRTTTGQLKTDLYLVISSKRTMDKKRRRLRVRFAKFQKNKLPDGQVKETVATVGELSDLFKPGATDGVPPL